MICFEFYSHLYSAQLDSPANVEAMDEFIGLLSDNIPPEAKTSLSIPLSALELKNALDEMAPHKSPCPE